MNYFNLIENNSETFYKFKKHENQKGGSPNNYSSSLIFNAIKENNYNALNFLINQKEIISINFKDNDGLTILHILINKLVDRNENENIMIIIENILQRADVNHIINIQDNNGNTPLHLCAISKNYILCDKLINAGANHLIKNNSGLYVESESESITRNTCINSKKPIIDQTIFISKKNLRSLKDNDDIDDIDDDKKDIDDNVEKNIMKNIISSLTTSNKLDNSSDSDSEEEKINVNQSSNINQSAIIDDTSEFINRLINTENNDKNLENLSHVINLDKFIGKNKDSNISRTLSHNATSDFLNDFINKYKIKINNKGGGTKKKIKNFRKLNTNTDYNKDSLEMPHTSVSSIIHTETDSNSDNETETTSNSDNDTDSKTTSNSDNDTDSNSNSNSNTKSDSKTTSKTVNDSDNNSLSELSRIINNKSTEIHERIVKKIEELLNISEQEARVIKAYIYNEVKIKHPELNNFDRAVEMEKKITNEYLKSLNKKKLKELSEIISEKQKSSEIKEKTSDTVKQKKSKIFSATSSMPDSSTISS
jgi:hypothetical protein